MNIFKSLIVAVGLCVSLSIFVPTAEAAIPLEERQRLIHERAKKEAEARRKRIEDRKNIRPYYYYYQYQYIRPYYYYYQPPVYYYPYRPTVYFWYRF